MVSALKEVSMMLQKGYLIIFIQAIGFTFMREISSRVLIILTMVLFWNKSKDFHILNWLKDFLKQDMLIIVCFIILIKVLLREVYCLPVG